MSPSDTPAAQKALTQKARMRRSKWRLVRRNYELYLFLLPAFLAILIFHYGPMYGLLMAFQDFSLTKGIWGSPWASHYGFGNFIAFVTGFNFWQLIRNTVTISLYSLLAGFPMPIILALMLNEVRNVRFKKIVQNVTYAPHFISTVVMVGMIITFLSPSIGIVNKLIEALGGHAIPFMQKPEYFRHIYVWSGIWQHTGYSSIIYLAALSNIDPELHEAARVDGASRLQRIRHINIPGILPTMVTLLILNSGAIMNVGFEKIFLMQNSLNLSVSQVISTYVYTLGILGRQFSLPSAIGMFNSVVNLILLVIVNSIARKVGSTSLW